MTSAFPSGMPGAVRHPWMVGHPFYAMLVACSAAPLVAFVAMIVCGPPRFAARPRARRTEELELTVHVEIGDGPYRAPGQRLAVRACVASRASVASCHAPVVKVLAISARPIVALRWHAARNPGRL